MYKTGEESFHGIVVLQVVAVEPLVGSLLLGAGAGPGGW